jgi:hypothetical protein
MKKDDPCGIPLQPADFLAHSIGANEKKWIDPLLKAGRLHRVTMPAAKIPHTSKQIEDMIFRQKQQRKAERMAHRSKSDENQL